MLWDNDQPPASWEEEPTVSGDVEFHVNAADEVFIRRWMLGKTERDVTIEQLTIPAGPCWRRIMIRMIRYYQRRWARRLGHRCVFDPSCSHYAEMAYRENGFFEGTWLTVKRLSRCRPENGGLDEPLSKSRPS